MLLSDVTSLEEPVQFANPPTSALFSPPPSSPLQTLINEPFFSMGWGLPLSHDVSLKKPLDYWRDSMH
ncbi:hypothetical protein TNCV_3560911 [Trichonephila clavipes]|nr:hypothetical protein TNCV_3560911 [Trichonephila clavipes]